MTDVPSGWYDDPEHPEQYRYWDGTNWTDHRAPKAVPQGPASGDASGIVTQGWSLLRRNWAPVALIWVALFAVFVVIGVIVIAQAATAIEPGVLTIIERFTEPGFDPENNPADELFVDSIEFTPGPSFWVVTIVGVIALVVAQLFFVGVAQIHLTAAALDHPFTLGESFRAALRRLPRWAAVYLLWGVLYAVAVVAVVLLYLLAAQIPLLLIMLVPVSIAGGIFVYPFLWIAPTALAIGRVEDPPLRATIGLIRARGWRRVAWPVLLVNLVVVGVSIGAGVIGVIPVLGTLVSLVAQLFLYALTGAMNIPLWRAIGGPVGTDIGGGADSEPTVT